MSRKLERYLISERKNLDVESPDDDAVWKDIIGRMHDRKDGDGRKSLKLRLIKYRNIAAVALIIFALGYITNDIVKRRSFPSIVTLSSIDSELGRQENQYKATISFKTDEVKSYNNTQDSIILQLFSELKKLDTIYNQSMKDLRELGPNERVINTIFATYEQKIRLLELIILETNKSESHEKNENYRKDEKTML
jgi:hypothetical protein